MSPDALHYATYFDRHYLTRGLALYESLAQHSPPFTLWVLCLDEETHRTLAQLSLDSVKLLSLASLEQANPALLQAKPARNFYEYFWTLTPVYLLHLLDQDPTIDVLTYVDADVFFYGDPSPLYSELADGGILLVECRQPPGTGRRPIIPSRFNVGFNAFRRSAEGITCLRRWREQCLEWCFDRVEPGRFGDQRYLDEWPDRYATAIISQHLGAGLASYNCNQSRLVVDNGRLLVERDPLIYYHFSKLRIVRYWLYEPGLWKRGFALSLPLKRHVYAPYARALRRASAQARCVGANIPTGDVRPRRNWQASPPEMLLHRTFLIVTDRFVL